MVKLNKVDELVVSTLKNAGKGLTLNELAETTGETSKKVFKSLKKLFENEMIDCQNRQYKLLNP
jgi:predicted transcriptional regulator